MSAFETYAVQAIPAAVQRQEARREAAAAKPLTALEKKMREKQRLSRAYRAWKREQREACLIAEPRLRDFLRYLRTVTPMLADELVEAIASSWLMTSEQAVRLFALDLVSRHCDRLNRAMGFEPLDDPMPPETSTYFRCRELLHAGGRA